MPVDPFNTGITDPVIAYVQVNILTSLWQKMFFRKIYISVGGIDECNAYDIMPNAGDSGCGVQYRQWGRRVTRMVFLDRWGHHCICGYYT
jgi:hypothetical protein